jgi:hypothetical protein
LISMSIKYNGKTVAGNYKIKLSNEASTTEEGLIRIATDEEAKAGELTNVAVTPEQLSKYGGGGSSGGGGTNTLVDDVTIVKDEDTDIITTIGVRTKNEKYLYDWIGTKAEYNQAIANGEISIDEDCVCWITDDSGSGGGGSVSVDIATTETAGIVKPDGTTITITEDGTISAIGGGGGSSTVVETDNKTITLNGEDKIQVVGSYTVNSQFKNEFVGTKEEYEQALAEGLITEDTVCTITDDTQDVVVPMASTDSLGVVKPDGETITVNENGIISAIVPDTDTSNLANIDLSNITDAGLQSIISNLSTVATSGSYNDLTDKPSIPNEYILPTASTDVLGGVKVDGSTISILDGVISAVAQSGGDEWEFSKGTNSYIKHKTSGLMIQGGTSTGTFTGETTFTLPTPFTTKTYSVVVFGVRGTQSLFISGGYCPWLTSRDTSKFVLKTALTSNAASTTVTWIAFGY